MECRRCEELTPGTFPGSLICSRTGAQIAYNRIDKRRPCEAKERTTPLVAGGKVIWIPPGWDKPIEINSKTPKVMISCDKCGAGFETAEEYRHHVMTMHDLACRYCRKKFQSDRSRAMHEVRCPKNPNRIIIMRRQKGVALC